MRDLGFKEIGEAAPGLAGFQIDLKRIRGGDLPLESDLSSSLSRKISVVRFGLRVIHGEKGQPERVPYSAP